MSIQVEFLKKAHELMNWLDILCGNIKWICEVSESFLCVSATAMQCGDSMTQLSEDATPLLVGSHEALEAEIKRLRERLHTVETENQAMSVKLNQQQWEIENRLAEIEMKICGASSTSSLEDNERNRESII